MVGLENMLVIVFLMFCLLLFCVVYFCIVYCLKFLKIVIIGLVFWVVLWVVFVFVIVFYLYFYIDFYYYLEEVVDVDDEVVRVWFDCDLLIVDVYL